MRDDENPELHGFITAVLTGVGIIALLAVFSAFVLWLT